MTHPIHEAPAAPVNSSAGTVSFRGPTSSRDRSVLRLALAIGLVSLSFACFLLPCSAQETGSAATSIAAAEGGVTDGEVTEDGVTAAAAAEITEIDTSEPSPTRPLTRGEEWRLGIEIRRSADWNIQDLGRREVMERLLGRDRLRQLEGARFQYALRDADPLYDHDLRDLAGLEEAEDTVLSAYSKLARETLEDVLGLDELEERSERWLDRHRSSRTSKRESGTQGRLGNSYRVRVSPRLADDYLGVKLKMPYTGSSLLDHLSLRVRYDFDEDRTLYMLKFDDNQRFLHLTYEPDTEEHGDELSLSFRLFW